MKRFDGRFAFVTGAAHGQGRAAALAFAREGASVGALDVARPLDYPGYAMGTGDELASLRDECEALGASCLTFAADVRDGVAVAGAVDQTVARLGAVDVLFNNAGICAYGLAHELSEAAWDAMIDINLKGAWIVGRVDVKLSTSRYTVPAGRRREHGRRLGQGLNARPGPTATAQRAGARRLLAHLRGARLRSLD